MTMRHALFGELLSGLVGLSDHDVSEVLAEQAISHRRFGEIALAFQWCRPQHVWQAWWAQLEDSTQRVLLPSVGVDTQALGSVPRALAEEYEVIPIRIYGEQIVLAASEESQPRAAAELPQMVRKSMRFVLAPERQIREAIAAHYRCESN
jgi:hypothetical protein